MEKTNAQRMDASVKVWLLWEGASNPSDDDIGGVVSSSDTLLQHMLLDQCREESWIDRRADVNLYASAPKFLGDQLTLM